MDIVQNPHDKFFKETLSQKKNAVSFLKNYLPKELLKHIIPENIAIEKDSYITDELKEYFSDILYKVELQDGEGYIYTLFEHKSSPALNVGLQLLEYLLQIWKAKKKNNQDLPVIIPIIVYHGQQDWNIANKFSKQITINAEIFKKYTPQFEFIVHDLSQEDIIGTEELKARLKLMKYINSDLQELLENTFKEIIGLDIKSGIIYIFSARNEDEEKIIYKAQKIDPKGGNIMKSTAEKLIQKGKEEGKREGKEEGWIEGKIEDAKNMLKEGIEINTICKVTGLSKKKVKKLKKNL